MRLGEAVGLLKSDINLDAEIPHISRKPHQWRTLKTKGSERNIPLVGASLWACERIMESNNDTQFAFPRYTNTSNCNANSASASLNKWLKDQLTGEYVIHSFRHSLRDRLRAVECPSDIVDRIGGWITAGVGQGYGKGYPPTVLNKWMRKIAIQFLAKSPYLFSTITRCFSNIFTRNFCPLTVKLLTRLVSLFIIVNPNKRYS